MCVLVKVGHFFRRGVILDLQVAFRLIFCFNGVQFFESDVLLHIISVLFMYLFWSCSSRALSPRSTKRARLDSDRCSQKRPRAKINPFSLCLLQQYGSSEGAYDPGCDPSPTMPQLHDHAHAHDQASAHEQAPLTPSSSSSSSNSSAGSSSSGGPASFVSPCSDRGNNYVSPGSDAGSTGKEMGVLPPPSVSLVLGSCRGTVAVGEGTTGGSHSKNLFFFIFSIS